MRNLPDEGISQENLQALIQHPPFKKIKLPRSKNAKLSSKRAEIIASLQNFQEGGSPNSKLTVKLMNDVRSYILAVFMEQKRNKRKN